MDKICIYSIEAPQHICGRAATRINQEVNKLSFSENVYFRKDDREAKVASLLGLLSLNIQEQERFDIIIYDGLQEHVSIILNIISAQE